MLNSIIFKLSFLIFNLKTINFQASIDRIPLDEIDLDPNSHDDMFSYLAGFLAILLDVETRAALIVLLA